MAANENMSASPSLPSWNDQRQDEHDALVMAEQLGELRLSAQI